MDSGGFGAIADLKERGFALPAVLLREPSERYVAGARDHLETIGGIGILERRRGRSSVVERQLPKLNVVGSIPIARSTPPSALQQQRTIGVAQNSSRWMVMLLGDVS